MSKTTIFYNNKEIEIFPNETIKIDERFDQIQDSITFTFYSSEITKNVEPFTLMTIQSNAFSAENLSKQFWIKTKCRSVIGSKNVYEHEATCYELTKILQALLLGSKAFSVVKNVENYNSNYDRINIICSLMRDKYAYIFKLDSNMQGRMQQEREFSFGSGTTMYDALLEIMNTEGCVPRVINYNPTVRALTISYDDIDGIVSQNVQETIFEDVSFDEIDQNVDEYCSQVETEMNDVIDRNTYSTVYLTPRSESNVVSFDNGCLITPENIEDIKQLSIGMDLTAPFKAPLLYMDARYFSQFPDSDRIPTANAQTPIPEDVAFKDTTSTFALMKLTDEGKKIYEEAKRTIGIYEGADTNYYKGSFWFYRNYKVVNNKAISSGVTFMFAMSNYKYDISMPSGYYYVPITQIVLEKKQYDLLETLEKPNFIYFEHGSNKIDGFANSENNDFWNSFLGTQRNPPIQSYNFNLYDQILDMNNITYEIVENGTPIVMGVATNTIYICYDTNKNYFEKSYKLKYYTMSSMSNVEEKETLLNTKMKTSRSYNNGANNIDYNLVINGMKREVNHLGLPCKIIQSMTNVSLGTHTSLGYVVEKITDILVERDSFIYTYFIYEDAFQIAAAIGVDSQYEATNIPSTGVLKRYLYYEIIASDEFKNKILNEETPVMLLIDKNKSLFMSRYYDNNKIILTAKMKDNYAFASKMVVSSYNSNYYGNKDVGIDNGFQKELSFQIYAIDDLTKENLDNYPEINLSNQSNYKTSTISRAIYKDSREQLIFTFCIK